MSANDSDLSFMRCPSCRSLVPASAARCRMCGFDFSSDEQSAGEAGQNGGDNRKSRVRQKTMSVSQEEIGALKDHLLEQQAAKDLEPSFEVSGSEESGSAVVPADEEIHLEHTKSQVTGVSAAEALFAHAKQAFQEPDAGSPSSQPTPALAEEPQPATAEPERVRKEQLGTVAESPRASTQSPQADADQSENDMEQPKRKRRRRRKRKSSDGHAAAERGDADSSRDKQQQSRSPASAEKSTKAQTVGNGPLVGWLVTYNDSKDGESLELRAGRFFVCRERIKPTDLVLPDSSLSTPHALIKADVGKGLRVQDLLSESGIAVRRVGEKEFEQQTEAVTLNHGDWIRFGSFEALVCLIAFSENDDS